MPCCKCNKSGTCQGCACAKDNAACVSCLPGKLGKCKNPENLQLDSDSTSSSSVSASLSRPTQAQVSPTPTQAQAQAQAQAQTLPVPPFKSIHLTAPETLLGESLDHSEQLVGTKTSQCTWSLPEPVPAADPLFTWGPHDGQSFIETVTAAYDEVVHWRPNLFLVPFGNAGKQFVLELARLYRAFAEGSALESIALKATTVLTILALQRPFRNSKAKTHSHYLGRRLTTWLNGDLQDLLCEGRTIQSRCFKASSAGRSKASHQPNIARKFANMMFQGKCSAALSVLSDRNASGVLGPDDVLPSGETVSHVLRSKHPPPQTINDEACPPPAIDPPLLPNPIMFDCIDADLIRHGAKHTNGAAGPSCMDAHGWRRICCTFKDASDDLCHSLALVARRMCTQFIDHNALAPLLACRLIALDKNPGVRPIGVCEVPRRIISKAILFVIKGDIQEAAGATQLCGGQIAGIEAAVHAIRQLFSSDKTEAILLVDASNAFNSLSRVNALANIRHLCPPFFTVLTNIYRTSSELFLGPDTLLSQEGTTQGDPLAMPFYALATRPLMNKLSEDVPEVKQVWYADDATAAGRIADLKNWWSKISTVGAAYGYFVNPSKTWLVTKEGYASLASELFSDSNVNLTRDGRPVLGSPIGTDSFISTYVAEKVQEWVNELDNLTSIADSQPHAAYSALTHGLYSKWNYIARTTPGIERELQPIEDTIRLKLIPKLTGREPPGDAERHLFGLPARAGGLNLPDPTPFSSSQYRDSLKVTAPLTELIIAQSLDYPYEALCKQLDAKNDIKLARRKLSDDAATQLRDSLTPSLQRAMNLSMEKGASSWLTVLPLAEHQFALHKQAFRDALALRYGWLPTHIPANCSCGQPFSVQHSLSCPKGGYPSIRHNELRDFTASLLSEACHGVAIEPSLQPITTESFRHASANTQDGARLDIVANGVWGSSFERAFFDVRVFNPYAPSNKHTSIAGAYKQHESLKKRHYEQRVREVEHASFTPLVNSTTGGLGPAATAFYKRLASMLADKWKQPYSSTLGWLRCRLSFSLLRSSIRCIRGARSSTHKVDMSLVAAVDLTIAQSKLV